MIGLESLRWLLTLAFAGAAAFHLVRCLRPADRVSEALHLAMSLSMIAMVWPWGDRVPAVAWIVVFTLSAGWFVARAVRSAARRLASWFFASTTAVMVWMSASMPAQAAAGHHEHGTSMPAAGYVAWISGGLGGYLVAAAVWWVVRGMRLGRLAADRTDPRPPNWTALCHGMMSAGMGLALLAMA